MPGAAVRALTCPSTRRCLRAVRRRAVPRRARLSCVTKGMGYYKRRLQRCVWGYVPAAYGDETPAFSKGHTGRTHLDRAKYVRRARSPLVCVRARAAAMASTTGVLTHSGERAVRACRADGPTLPSIDRIAPGRRVNRNALSWALPHAKIYSQRDVVGESDAVQSVFRAEGAAPFCKAYMAYHLRKPPPPPAVGPAGARNDPTPAGTPAAARAGAGTATSAAVASSAMSSQVVPPPVDNRHAPSPFYTVQSAITVGVNFRDHCTHAFPLPEKVRTLLADGSGNYQVRLVCTRMEQYHRGGALCEFPRCTTIAIGGDNIPLVRPARRAPSTSLAGRRRWLTW